MLKATLIGILLSAFLGSLFSQVQRPSVNWQRIYHTDPPGTKIFIDTNSVEIDLTQKDRKYVGADILISYSTSTPIESDGKTILIHGIVVTVIIECGGAIIAPVHDLYFEEEKPSRKMKPIGGKTYPSGANMITRVIDKKSPIYTAMCPSYI